MYHIARFTRFNKPRNHRFLQTTYIVLEPFDHGPRVLFDQDHPQHIATLLAEHISSRWKDVQKQTKGPLDVICTPYSLSFTPPIDIYISYNHVVRCYEAGTVKKLLDFEQIEFETFFAKRLDQLCNTDEILKYRKKVNQRDEIVNETGRSRV